ncbi:GNAT family N-acetyltransferase [Flavobacterium oreochromis]|uniref:GNAT family N-acetyltransferase n=1 Tax=Flavobacterium oreochromis TaxID=2906078 RepID=UPI001CE528EA|nr:GNAT family protein [Flavobacterium oreochromis]QYS86476.1 GNAT family N-acetyltransferase [Flavobacterium oreochromis]
MVSAIETLFNPDFIIENELIKLRIVSPGDLSQLEEIASDPSIWKYYTVELYTEEDLKLYVQKCLADFSTKSLVPFVIIDKQINKIVGMSAYGNISVPDRRIEIGWSWIGSSFQGTGVNGSYKKLLLKFAFEYLDFLRVEFKTDVLNGKARKALLKIGATEEGILRSHTLMHHDRRRDTIYYSILKEEWLKQSN